MKRITMNLMLIALIVVPILIHAQSGEYVIKGSLTASKKGAMAYLVQTSRGKKIVDSIAIKNGRFEFKGKVDDPILSRLYIDHAGKGINSITGSGDLLNLYLEKGTISIVARDSIKNGKILGSNINDQYISYQAALPQSALGVGGALASGGRNNPESIKLIAEKKEAQRKYIKENPSSYFSLEALTEIIDFYRTENFDSFLEMFDSLSPEVKRSSKGQLLESRLNVSKATSVGAIAMDFTQNDVNDKPVKLSDFRGKYVLIDFWASWCGPCRGENPHLVKAYNKYNKLGFEILGVSLDSRDKKQDWLDAIEKDGLPWVQVSNLEGWKNSAAVLYGVTGIPSNFLVNPEGYIVARNLRGVALEQKLFELLHK